MTTFNLLHVPHGISDRNGGVSIGPYATMNTSFYGYDDKKNVYENIKRCLETINCDAKIIVATQQVHSNTILVLDEFFDFSRLEALDLTGSALETYKLYISKETDGLISTREDVVLMTFYADCVPLMYYDPIKRIVASVHSGWRGTSNLIGQEAVRLMIQLGSKVEDINVGIGPCADKCCYEVDQTVLNAFKLNFKEDTSEVFSNKKANGRYMLDLKAANILALRQVGINLSQIEFSEHCTICSPEKYHSHRRTGYPRGSMSAFIQLK